MGPSQTRNQYGIFGADWTYLPTGDGFYVVRDWWNPEYIYYESQFGAIGQVGKDFFARNVILYSPRAGVVPVMMPVCASS